MPPWKSSRKITVLLAAILAVLVLAAFQPAMDNDFVGFDDTDYVTANFMVQRGLTWETVTWAFTSTDAANWHPLTWLTHLLDVEWYGLNPAGHHLTGVGLHYLATLLLFFSLRALTGATWRSFLVAVLFGVHPLRVESVAWVAERKDVLGAVFWFLTVWSYAGYVRAADRGQKQALPRFALTVLCFACGLMSKPMLVTLPFALLLLDFWPLKRWRRDTFARLLREKWPLFVLSAASSGVTYYVQRSAGAVNEITSFGSRLGNALISFVRYLGKIFWPADLAFFYPHPATWSVATVLLATLLLALISALAIRLWRRHPSLFVGWSWFLGTLIPVIGLVQVGQQSIADRYTYIPSVGVLLALVWGVAKLLETRPTWLRMAGVFGGAVGLLLLFLTREQTRVWRSTETLCRHAIAVTRGNYLAHDMLGAALDKQGNSDEALQEHVEALRIKPDYADAHNNLAVALQRQGKLAEAIAHYETALRLRPRYPEARFNLGVALAEAGRLEEALAEYQRALALRPRYPDAWYNLGLGLARLGRMHEAVQAFDAALKINPAAADVHNNLGVALSRIGRVAEAIKHYQIAIRLQPDYARAHFNLGVALSQSDQRDAAVEHFGEALRLNPDYAEARTNLDALLETGGKILSR